MSHLPIQLLSPQLANQIAAGEVVERPASVVKELLENSLDAGATKIEVDIEKGGHKRIRIKDNGSGIEKDELQLALSRHATSKITSLDDLEQILSLGFRGEALASISSVSRLTLTSRTEHQSEAWQAYCEGRDMAVSVKPAAHPVGTTIDVADLFYNTPARRKFLRTEKTEFQHIEEVIKRIALSNPDISFILKHNDKVVKRYISDKEGRVEARIGAVVGHKFVQNAVHVKSEYEGIIIDAWLGNEVMLRSSNDCQFSFVNGRGMRDKLIMHAIRQAYESAWGVLEQPSFVVFLTLNPREVDVNVHPAKHEVRFQQSRLVHDFICKTVSDALHATSDDGDTAVQGHSNQDYMTPDVTHDYIRPLQTHQPEHLGSQRASSYQPHTKPSVSEGSITSTNSYQGANPSVRERAQGGASFSSGRFQSKTPSSAYQTSYRALMTPNSDTLTDTTHSHSNVEGVNLTPYKRIYPKADKIYMVSVEKLASIWLSELFLNAQHSQPLLMPVAIPNVDVNESTLVFFKSLHFEINRVAGKYRLQQVPAGTRHLPWLKWFEHIITIDAPLEEYAKAELASVITIPLDGIEIEVAQLIWNWFELLDEVKQWEYIAQFAKVRPLKMVLEVWGE